MNLHGMNKKYEETNYCAFDKNRKLKGTKDCIFIYAKSSFAFSVRDQKLSVVPSLTRFGVS